MNESELNSSIGIVPIQKTNDVDFEKIIIQLVKIISDSEYWHGRYDELKRLSEKSSN